MGALVTPSAAQPWGAAHEARIREDMMLAAFAHLCTIGDPAYIDLQRAGFTPQQVADHFGPALTAARERLAAVKRQPL